MERWLYEAVSGYAVAMPADCGPAWDETLGRMQEIATSILDNNGI
jgi:hypothetical protein